MKIANEKTFQQFDKLRQQFFAHKVKQARKSNPVPNPISNKFRYVLPLMLITGGLWLVYKNMPSLSELLLQRQLITHQELIAYESIRSYMRCRWKHLLSNPQDKSNLLLLNDIYITKLESDYLYLIKKRSEKKLDTELKSSFSLWVFNFGNEQSIHLINSYGDLMFRKYLSKCMIGDSVRIWTTHSDLILRRQSIFARYLKQQSNIGNQCKKVNWMNRVFHSEQEYEISMKDCMDRSNVTTIKIKGYIQQRMKQEKDKKILERKEV